MLPKNVLNKFIRSFDIWKLNPAMNIFIDRTNNEDDK